MALQGTEHSVTTGRFQEAKFHWPLSGHESWKVTVASVPVAAVLEQGAGVCIGVMPMVWLDM